MDRLDVIQFAVLIPSVVLHEVSHGALALVFGDDTAKRARRLTLNPLRHVDPFGTVLLPAMLLLVGTQPFGYAKPVPVNPRQLRSPRNQTVLVSLVGPAVNIVLALVAALLLTVLLPDRGDEISLWVEVAFALGVINVVLATFNLIPVPPLDGSALVERVLPRAWWPTWLRLRQYSMGIVLLLVLLAPNVLGELFDWAIDQWDELWLP
jgi:Zn-dependent protease